MQRAMIRLFLVTGLVVPCLVVAAGTVPSVEALDAAREWLWAHPPDGTNRAGRQERMALIQAAADTLSARAFRSYMTQSIAQPEKADEAQNEGILYYLNQATNHAIADLRATEVEKGVVLWHFYNMGYVFKTPEACFGIDICLRDADRLEPDLDFLLITHEHGDHHFGGLPRAMINAGKPVISRFLRDGIHTNEPGQYTFGSIHVSVSLGDHHPRNGRGNDMLQYEVDCGPSGNDVVIFHSGDGANIAKMKPVHPVNVFIPHVDCSGMDVAEAIRTIGPKLTLVSHVLELAHNRRGARWTYDHAFEKIAGLPPAQATVLTWGERLLLPGTLLAGNAPQ